MIDLSARMIDLSALHRPTMIIRMLVGRCVVDIFTRTDATAETDRPVSVDYGNPYAGRGGKDSQLVKNYRLLNLATKKSTASLDTVDLDCF